MLGFDLGFLEEGLSAGRGDETRWDSGFGFWPMAYSSTIFSWCSESFESGLAWVIRRNYELKIFIIWKFGLNFD